VPLMRCLPCSRVFIRGKWRDYKGIPTWVCAACAPKLKPPRRKKGGPAEL